MSAKIMLDSGAYTAWTKGVTIDIDAYVEFIKVNSTIFDEYINLDVIMDARASYKNWQYLRRAGIDALPVYHLGTDEKWLEKYLKYTDHIGLGAIAKLDTSQRLMGLTHIWNKYLIDKQTGLPKVKVHGLGLTAIDIILKYPWYSVDSTTPVILAAFGGVLLPKLHHEGLSKASYFNLTPYKISDQGKHLKGLASSYLSLPKLAKAQYELFFKTRGFDLGIIENKAVRPRRKKSLNSDRRVDKIFDLPYCERETVDTIAGDWAKRLHWNMEMWHELRMRFPVYPSIVTPSQMTEENIVEGTKCLMYVGASTRVVLHKAGLVTPKHDVLISYYYCSSSLLGHVKNYRDGKF